MFRKGWERKQCKTKMNLQPILRQRFPGLSGRVKLLESIELTEILAIFKFFTTEQDTSQ